VRGQHKHAGGAASHVAFSSYTRKLYYQKEVIKKKFTLFGPVPR
jgi:hypothetical protein